MSKGAPVVAATQGRIRQNPISGWDWGGIEAIAALGSRRKALVIDGFFRMLLIFDPKAK